MFRPRILPASPRRRAVILMVVLVLLTLFAVVGLAFVLYANAQADDARAYRETPPTFPTSQPNERADSFINYALGQLLYGVPDPVGAYPDGAASALRGYEFARDIYGWNADNKATNIYPFNGVGRLHNPITLPSPPFLPNTTIDDHNLLNYQPFLMGVGSSYTLIDQFMRDPEYTGPALTPTSPYVYGFRQTLNQNKGGYIGGWNSSYTYPDGNHVYLGAVDSNGNVLQRSFWRPALMPNTWLNGASTSTPCLPLDPSAPGYWTWTSNVNPNNPNETIPYYSTVNPPASIALKYFSLRPRNFDMAPGFPLPGLGGDVRNLRGGPTNYNDSIWVDLDYPVKTASNGLKYKPLFAFFIMDLDGKVNINSHGNVRALVNGQMTHVSNQGWSRAEVNPAQLASVLASDNAQQTAAKQLQQAEWPQLFVGSATYPNIPGKYGVYSANPATPPMPTSGNGNNLANSGRAPHIYSPVDYDASNDGQGGAATGAVTWNPASPSCFATYPAGYGNGSVVERTYHPLLYDPIIPRSDPVPTPPTIPYSNFNRRFSANQLVHLYNSSVLGTNALNCDVGKLLPLNMSSSRIRSMITTDSYHLDRPALTPWLWDRTSGTTATYDYSTVSNADGPPVGKAQNFPTLSQRWTPTTGGVPGFPNTSLVTDSEFRLPGQSNFTPSPPNQPGAPNQATTFNPAVDWRAIDAVLSKVNVNRFLPPFPHQGSGTTAATYNPAPLTGTVNGGNFTPDPNARYDDPNNPNLKQIQTQYNAAMQARQTLANDIYRRLLLVTGAPAIPAADQASPTEDELAPRRWLAQLAVNIVDFVDEDELSTPFNFYTTGDGLAAANLGATTTPGTTGETSPKYWVFGTELPKVLINEALAEYSGTPANLPGKFNVNVFVELFNPIPVPPANSGTQPQDSLAVQMYVPAAGNAAAYNPYVLVVADNNVTNPAPKTPNASGLAAPSLMTNANKTASNDLVLGTPNVIRAQTDFSPAAGTIQTVDQKPQPAQPQVGGPAAGGVQNPQFFLVGPGQDARGTIAPKGQGNGVVPTGTPMLTTSNLTYTVDVDVNGNWSTNKVANNDKNTGVCVLLRRLANPHMPPDTNVTVAGSNPPQANPNYNPYITVDYIGGGFFKTATDTTATPSAVVLQDTTQAKNYYSTAKKQPYGAYPTEVLTPAATPSGNTPTTNDTFGSVNDATTQQKQYDPMFHLDRQLVSPMDLLHVSGYVPHGLTHHFKAPTTQAGTAVSYAHQINWFDETNRLYRAFEFLVTKDRTTGVSLGGRVPGMININTIYDLEVFRALCDSQGANGFSQTDVDRIFAPQIPTVAGKPDPTQYNPQTPSLLTLRSPGLVPPNAPGTAQPPGWIPEINKTTGPFATTPDRPFLSMGTGNQPTTDPQTVYENGTQKPSATGVEDLFLRSLNANATNYSYDTRLFQVPAQAPLTTGQTKPTAPTSWTPLTPAQTELMRKIYASTTTRSNVFAVWCTVGFFRVVDDTVRPVKLAEELGSATNTNIRPRFFAIIDRSRMVIAPPGSQNLPTTVSTVYGSIQPLGSPTLPPPVPTAPQQTNVQNQPTAVQITAISGTVGPNGIPWQIQPPGGTLPANVLISPTPPNNQLPAQTASPANVLVIDMGTPFEETVVLQTPPAGWTPPPGAQPAPGSNYQYWMFASFQKPHGPGATITFPGNPGPQGTFNLNDASFSGIVAAYGILE